MYNGTGIFKTNCPGTKCPEDKVYGDEVSRYRVNAQYRIVLNCTILRNVRNKQSIIKKVLKLT